MIGIYVYFKSTLHEYLEEYTENVNITICLI